MSFLHNIINNSNELNRAFEIVDLYHENIVCKEK